METRLARATVIAVTMVACKASPATGVGDAGAPLAASSAAVAVPSPSSSAQVLALKREAIKLSDQWELDKAKEKILEAQKLAPDDPDLKQALINWEEMNATRVAGQWFKTSEKDAMTDKVNVNMSLPATNNVSTGYAEKRPVLVARCIKGTPDLLIHVGAIVDADIYDNAKATYRFDSEAPQTAAMTAAQGKEGLFFKEPSKWFDRVIAHASGKLIVEIPLYGRVPEAVTFDLTGADVAIPPVKDACASKK